MFVFKNCYSTLCPDCWAALKYYLNPEYLWVCDNCKWSGYGKEVKRKLIVKKAQKAIDKLKDEVEYDLELIKLLEIEIAKELL